MLLALARAHARRLSPPGCYPLMVLEAPTPTERCLPAQQAPGPIGCLAREKSRSAHGVRSAGSAPSPCCRAAAPAACAPPASRAPGATAQQQGCCRMTLPAIALGDEPTMLRLEEARAQGQAPNEYYNRLNYTLNVYFHYAFTLSSHPFESRPIKGGGRALPPKGPGLWGADIPHVEEAESSQPRAGGTFGSRQ
eukprot:scaffold7219_cov540-Prasinococcus_capsulatus_cf.AAC.4